jgi:hypothetical protein
MARSASNIWWWLGVVLVGRITPLTLAQAAVVLVVC